MNNKINKINEILNLNSNEIIEYDEQLPVIYDPVDSDDDVEEVRKNLKDLIQKGTGAVDELLNIADSSQHPRAYEVIGSLINTLTNVNKELINLKKNKKEETPVNNKNTQNNFYVGSTTELLNLIKSANKNNES
jgi:tetrahydromethanopterin S-methyltransferase subunit A